MPPKEPVPGYELLEVLGEGGMATVFKARQRSTGRTCAVKVLRDFDAAGEDRRERRLERFAREGQLLELLDHPNVVKCIAKGEDAGSAWIALELVDGPSLESILERQGGPVAVPVALALVAEIAKALDHLSRKGVIHRDVKPSNVIVTAGGGVKLVDFGIACSTDEGKREREDGLVLSQDLPIGTIDYMAPEQVESEKVDEQVDVFALGSTAYRCLAGMTPFTGETVFARLRELVQRDPPPLPRDVPQAVRELVLAMLAKDPKKRPRAAQVVKTVDKLAREVANLEGEGWTRQTLAGALGKPRAKEKPAATSEPGPVLCVLSSDDVTIERPLRIGEGFVIGRSLQDGMASTSIGRAWISRQHCRLELSDRGLVVTDLRSANGTYVNHLKVEGGQSALLRPGDKLTLGKTTLVVAFENAPASLVQPAWKCLLCQVELPRDAGSTDEATGVEERHLCARCRARIEEDRGSAEKRAREAIAKLGGTVLRRLELGGPILRFDVEGQDKRRLAAHALDLGPSAASTYVERSKAALALEHPGLLKARGVHASSGVLVIVSDPITTRTAAESVLREGPLPPEEARRAIAVLARAVAHARAKGVTSIAVRPQLVLLHSERTAGGRAAPRAGATAAAGAAPVQLMDVGLAPGLVEAGRSRVELGRSVPCYDAPEAEGVRDATARAVTWSIAGVGYFLLTGEPPAELRSGARRLPAPPLALRADLPPRLAKLIDRALSSDPAERPADPEQLARELEALDPNPVPARPSRPLALTEAITIQDEDDLTNETTDETDVPAAPKRDSGQRTMVLTRVALAPLPGPLAPLPAHPAPTPSRAAPRPPQPARVDLAARLERLARDRASGVLTIHGALARGKIELAAGRIARVAAPSAELALSVLATVLAAKEAATTFEPNAKLEPNAPRVDVTVAEALSRARGDRT